MLMSYLHVIDTLVYAKQKTKQQTNESIEVQVLTN